MIKLCCLGTIFNKTVEDIDEISNNSQDKLENENGDKTYISEEIARLNKLKNDGILTDEEFEKAKQKLLS